MSSPFYGERIYLTPMQNNDIPQFAQWVDDFNLQQLVNPGIFTPTDAETLRDPNGWLQRSLNDPNSYDFSVRDLQSDTLMGMGALVGVHAYLHHAEIGINLANPDYRGRGYGGDVMQTLMRFGFLHLNLHRIYLTVWSYNHRAVRLYERLGFVHEGVQRQFSIRDGDYHDSLYMGILRREWSELYG